MGVRPLELMRVEIRERLKISLEQVRQMVEGEKAQMLEHPNAPEMLSVTDQIALEYVATGRILKRVRAADEMGRRRPS